MAKATPWTGTELRAFQEAAGLTNERLAERLHVSVRAIAYWRKQGDDVLPRLAQRALSQALSDAPDAVRRKFLAVADSTDAVAGIGISGLVANALHDADSDHMRFGNQVDPVTLEQLWDESLEIARASNRPPIELFSAAHRIRGRALDLAGQTRRPKDLSDLYRLSGQATALMASATFDLNQWDASARLARSAVSHASLAEHQSLEAWTLGLAALLANWRDEPDTALRHYERGMQVAPPGSPRVRLKFIAARSYALLGDAQSVADVLDDARRDQDEADKRRDGLADEVGGEFAFGRARAEACAAAAWLDLGSGLPARAAAQRAISELAHLPSGRQSTSQVTGARIDMATACLLSRELDQAAELLSGAIDVQTTLRNMSLSGRLSRAWKTLRSPCWSGDSRARGLADTIGDWLTANATTQP